METILQWTLIELSKYKVTFVFVSFFNSDITQVVEIIPRGSHYSVVIMGAMASQITSLTTVYATFHSGADQRKYQNSTSLAFVGEIHRSPVNSTHKGPVTRKKFPSDDYIMLCEVNTIVADDLETQRASASTDVVLTNFRGICRFQHQKVQTSWFSLILYVPWATIILRLTMSLDPI